MYAKDRRRGNLDFGLKELFKSRCGIGHARPSNDPKPTSDVVMRLLIAHTIKTMAKIIWIMKRRPLTLGHAQNCARAVCLRPYKTSAISNRLAGLQANEQYHQMCG